MGRGGEKVVSAVEPMFVPLSMWLDAKGLMSDAD